MNLREHAEMAAIFSRFVLVPPGSRTAWPEKSRDRFWKTVDYLEHLWAKEHDRLTCPGNGAARGQLYEEILASSLLLRVVATAGISPEHWQRHALTIDRLLEFEPGLPLPAQSRLNRMRKRLSHWGDFLVSRHPEGENFGDDPERCREFRDCYRLQDEAVWTLMTEGISRAIPDRVLNDLTRAAVQTLLLEAAFSMISPQIFLRDGRVKPRWMRRIEPNFPPEQAG